MRILIHNFIVLKVFYCKCIQRKFFKASNYFWRDDGVSKLNSRLNFCFWLSVADKCLELCLLKHCYVVLVKITKYFILCALGRIISGLLVSKMIIILSFRAGTFIVKRYWSWRLHMKANTSFYSAIQLCKCIKLVFYLFCCCLKKIVLWEEKWIVKNIVKISIIIWFSKN